MKLLITTQVVDREHSNLGFFHRWIEEFARQCETVHVICLQEGVHQFPENVFVHSLGKEKGTGRIVRALRFFRYIWQLRGEYDAVFVHMNPEYVVLGGPLWRLWGKKVALWYVHKSVTFWLRVAAMFSNVIFSVSEESFPFANKKLHAAGHGIDVSVFLPHMQKDAAQLRVITVGRIAESKHQVEMLHVLDVLYARGVPFTFTVVGAPLTAAESAYAQKLDDEIAKRPYRDAIKMTGALAYGKVPEALSKADVFLHMSTTGGVDKAVLDSLAAQTPVVSTSELFKNMPGVVCVECDAEVIAETLKNLPHFDPEALRAYIAERHDLSRLVSNITTFLTV